MILKTLTFFLLTISAVFIYCKHGQCEEWKKNPDFLQIELTIVNFHEIKISRGVDILDIESRDAFLFTHCCVFLLFVD